MAASSTLKKITTRAKAIYKKGGTWKTAIKKAGAEYRATAKKKPARKKTAKRRKVSGTLSGGAKPASYSVGKVKRRRKVSGTLSAGSSPSANAIGRVTTVQLINHAKKRIDKQIGEIYTKIFLAATKMEKRKLQKKLNAAKSKYKKLV
jgi:hypothetical protein